MTAAHATGEAADAGTADFPRAEPALLARFARLPAANIGDAMDRLGVLDSRIQAIWAGARLTGCAFTVWTRAGDNKLLHEALDLARPGDVLVVNGQGDESRALIGELMGGRAKSRGIAGFVLDGAARDAHVLSEIGFPVFARAVTPAGPYKNGPGRLGCTIAAGGVAVAPGDIVVGDGDGVVVVPLADAEAVAARAEAKHAAETATREQIWKSLP